MRWWVDDVVAMTAMAECSSTMSDREVREKASRVVELEALRFVAPAVWNADLRQYSNSTWPM